MQELDKTEQRQLLALARAAIAVELGLAPPGSENSMVADDSRMRHEKRGAFVTLRLDGSLRGCIGSMTAVRPLADTISMMALSSAFRDPRFPPLREEEFDTMSVEISVLSPLERISDPQQVVPGRHGIYLTGAGRSGVLLPQVATEQGWNREEFLSGTCRKAGLSPDAWRRGDIEIDLFTAQVFSEDAVSG